MNRWIEFKGTAEPAGDGFVLEGAGGGKIELKGEDVKIEGDSILVRRGSIARRLVMPAKARPAERTAPLGCPGGDTYCIGLVEFCCSNDEAIGTCFGIWTC